MVQGVPPHGPIDAVAGEFGAAESRVQHGVALRLQPLLQQRDVGGAAHAVRPLDYDEPAGHVNLAQSQRRMAVEFRRVHGDFGRWSSHRACPTSSGIRREPDRVT